MFVLWPGGPSVAFLPDPAGKRTHLGYLRGQALGGVQQSLDPTSQKPTIQVVVSWADLAVKTLALADSGTAGYFMDETFAVSHNVPLVAKEAPLTIEAIDGRSLVPAQITMETIPLRLSIGALHSEVQHFQIIHSQHHALILGFQRLHMHNPRFNWQTCEITAWSEFCDKNCISHPTRIMCASPSVPAEYEQFRDVFSKGEASALPPHRACDCVIDLPLGAVPPWGRAYPLSCEENQAMEDYIADALQRGIIRKSSSSAGTGLFFVKKKKSESNKKAHHTDMYHNSNLVLRRGQSYWMTMEFDEALLEWESFVFTAQTGPPNSNAQNTNVKFALMNSWSSGTWSAVLESRPGNSLRIIISTPANAVIGRYNLSVQITIMGNTATYSLGKFILLFNPWCIDDDVYMENEDERNEYVLNDHGIIFMGNEKHVTSLGWNFGQFEESILDICMDILDRSLEHQRNPVGDCSLRNSPIYVGRVVSAMVNSNDEFGVLEGKWEKDFSGGVDPNSWNGSVEILWKWQKENYQPVKYGQCWVFAAVMCTVLRCLGIPTRLITNFNSAHNTDTNLNVDLHYDPEGKFLEISDDSIWNFHVWNESWFVRKDLGSSYDGWQVLDSTPQEQSLGIYRCGPTSVIAVKEGDVSLGYDTPFVFCEVNSDRVAWICHEDGRKEIAHSDTKSVGKSISTKAVGSNARVDVTHNYKYPEGSQKEREVFEKASKMVSYYRTPVESASDNPNDTDSRLRNETSVESAENNLPSRTEANASSERSSENELPSRTTANALISRRSSSASPSRSSRNASPSRSSENELPSRPTENALPSRRSASSSPSRRLANTSPSRSSANASPSRRSENELPSRPPANASSARPSANERPSRPSANELPPRRPANVSPSRPSANERPSRPSANELSPRRPANASPSRPSRPTANALPAIPEAGALPPRPTSDELPSSPRPPRSPRYAVPTSTAVNSLPDENAYGRPVISGKFKINGPLMVGEDINLVLVLKNLATYNKRVRVILSASCILYTGRRVNDIFSGKTSLIISPSQDAHIAIRIPYSDYGEFITVGNMIQVVALCELPFSEKVLITKDLVMDNPPIIIKPLGKPTLYKTLTVDVRFTNPLSVPVNDCVLMVEGAGLVGRQLTAVVPFLKPKQKIRFTVELTPYRSGFRQLLVHARSKYFSIKGFKQLFVSY
ncbi:protein-glutamine gamma-glutamyltransferase E-like [Rhinophrynus dorsalis]